MNLKFLSAGLIAATLMFGAKAEANDFEILAGDKGVTIDTKITAEVAPRTNVYLRGITYADYSDNIGYFGLADLTVNIIEGLDAVAEIQFVPEFGAIFRAGVQYYKEIGDFSFYGLGTAGLSKNPDGEFLVELKYLPEIAENVKLLFSAENVTNFNVDGHNLSSQKLRTGLKLDKYSFGVAADLSELKDVSGEILVDSNIGGFGKVDF